MQRFFVSRICKPSSGWFTYDRSPATVMVSLPRRTQADVRLQGLLFTSFSPISRRFQAGVPNSLSRRFSRFFQTASKCNFQRFLTNKPLPEGEEPAGGGRAPRRKRRSREILTLVEPNQEEEFMFLEYLEEETGKADDVVYEQKIKDYLQKGEDVPQKSKLKSTTEVFHQALEQQMKSLEPLMKPELEAKIDFVDEGFPVPDLPSKSKKKKRKDKIYGTPDPEVVMSDDRCSGCGAVMHCIDPSLAGYLPSEKYKSLLEAESLNKAICQRCFLFIHHQKALDIKVSKEEYRNIVSKIRDKDALVLLMVDLLELPNSIISDILDLVGENKNILVLGNKIDLIPGDSKNYLKRIKKQLFDYCVNAGIYRGDNIKDIHFISAKTGYGVETLISKLQRSWKYKGDVYLVGTTNVGKSTLFNMLLESDYCKSKASEVIQRATISPWPGTTLNLLKFPIINPTPYRMFRRMERLKADALKSEKDLSQEEQNHLNRLKKQGYLIGRVGRTFISAPKSKNQDTIDFDPDTLSFNIEEEDNLLASPNSPQCVEFTYNELKDANWFYDTPGIVKEDCVLNILSESELKIVLPSHSIIPRTFVLHPGMVLFLGALGRIDFLKGEKPAWFSVIASKLLPVHITSLEKADAIYQKHAGKPLLGVPIGGEERMKEFPALVHQDIELEGIGPLEAVADIRLSSAGWVAITAHSEDKLYLRGYTPSGCGLMVRKPPLLPYIVHIKGDRIKKTPAYKTKRTEPLLDNLRSDVPAKP
ncbi:nitric oxide-associated protein 1 isoform X2 [Latimeria chalumnae]|uniref:nitric oxide-associated protein 1 isoform X2 n=1 Tax=Latimeria chalumnae TaxID=7897 RepID=UPI00313E6FC8